MPNVMTVSDLQRNMKEVAERCAATREPVYLTRNGRPALVIMDAEAYDEEKALRELIYEREIRVYRRGLEGHAQIERGERVSLEEARRLRDAS